MSQSQGFLAIWCEISPADLADYRAWLTREHIADRIFLPGFHGMRLFSAPDNPCAHFFLYLTDGLHVLKGPGYKQVLDNPSPWTRRLMPKFGPFDRAIGEQVLKLGVGFGSHVLVSRVRSGGRPLDLALARSAARSFLELNDVVGVRWMNTDRATTGAASQEKTMRAAVSQEGNFDHLLVVEAMSEAGATAAQAALGPVLRASIGTLESSDALVRQVIYGQAPYEGEVAGPSSRQPA